MNNLSGLTAEKINTILGEVLRNELARILAEQNGASASAAEDIDDRIEALERKATAVRRGARHNAFDEIEDTVRAAARVLGFPLDAPLPASVGRRAAALVRDLCELETEVLDGGDAHEEAAPLVERFSTATVEDFAAAPVRLSDTWARALETYPSKHMKGNIDAIAKLAIAHFGDIPVAAISEEDQKRFFVWMARLPKKHGKKHGKNRFCRDAPKEPERFMRTKDDEIAEADARDAAKTEEIRGLNNLSNVEKRALLSDELTPRLTLTTIKRNRDGLNRLFKAADELGCKPAPRAISYKTVERAIIAARPENDPLYVRVTQPKIRTPWTEERLKKFLTCPIFTGCFSKHRRWRPGTVIIRDSLYWVPLIVLTIGSRIEEILLLKRKNVVLRNGVHCLAIGLDPDQGGKTEDSRRFIPIPQLLLDLGFVEWVNALGDDHGPLLFPDAARRSKIDDLTGPFSKALNLIFKHLDLGDFDEDFYALRKTLSSSLNAAQVSEGQRQAIAGHTHGKTINRHYTAFHTRDLKVAIDKADFRIEIADDPRRGFPVIASCGLAPGESLKVEVTLGDHGEAERIQVIDPESGTEIFEFDRVDPVTGTRLPGKVVRDAARRFRKLVGESPMKMPRSNMKRSAIEHFHGLA